MKILILTSSERGSAAHHLPYLVEHDGCEVVSVILNKGNKGNSKKFYKRKIKKMMKVGPLGTLNGIRMRKWYREDLRELLATKSLSEQCASYGIPFFETPSINCPRTRKLFREAHAQTGLSLGNGYIREDVFSIPEYGMLNIHHELLPEYQNAQSIIWQLYNESRYSGYTIHKINKYIDAGKILLREKVPIAFKDTLGETVTHTQALLLQHSAHGLTKVLDNFEDYYEVAEPQGAGQKYTTPTFWEFLKIHRNYRKLKKENA